MGDRPMMRWGFVKVSGLGHEERVGVIRLFGEILLANGIFRLIEKLEKWTGFFLCDGA